VGPLGSNFAIILPHDVSFRINFGLTFMLKYARMIHMEDLDCGDMLVLRKGRYGKQEEALSLSGSGGP